MKLSRFTFRVFRDWWNILPTIEIHGRDYVYYENNFQICIHFLCFHWRWLFMEVQA